MARTWNSPGYRVRRQLACSFRPQPRTCPLGSSKRVLRYLKCTKTWRLTLGGKTHGSQLSKMPTGGATATIDGQSERTSSKLGTSS